MKVLAIDDNLDILQLMKITVEGAGHTFESASDSNAGLRLIETNTYDIVFLDINMPNLTGLDIVRRLVRDGAIGNQRIVLFTATYMGLGSEMESLMKNGIYAILAKPADIDQIFDLLQRAESEISGQAD